MLFSRSIAFDEENQLDAISAAEGTVAFPNAELRFIERLKNADPDAYESLVNQFAGDIYALLCRLTGSPEEASDLTQETFLSVLGSIKGFRGDSGLRTWLFRIAINHSRNRFRWWKRRKREATVSLDAEIGGSDIKVHETLSDGGLNPEESAISIEREKAVLKALGQLPVAFREVIVLCDLEGFSYQEIAVALGVNLGTVKSRIARGREELRRKLRDF